MVLWCSTGNAVLLLLLKLLLAQAQSRSWTAIPTFHPLGKGDASLFAKTAEIDGLFSSKPPTYPPTDAPSPSPSSLPTATPSQSPSLSPTQTAKPTNHPTPLPTTDPTSRPTNRPSSASPTLPPTYEATPVPTKDYFPENPPPSDPPTAYFNYDQNSNAKYGPGYPELVVHNATTKKVMFRRNGWYERYQVPDDWYWHEFHSGKFSDPTKTYYGILSVRNPTKNRCAGIGLQSPIDVTANGAKCHEHHQIRPSRGNIPFIDLKAIIEPNKLRIIVPRRPCLDIRDEDSPCVDPYPPGADLPHGWGGKADVTHVDIKIPSEHLLEGRRYDMEFQIWNFHISRRRNPVITIMVEAVHGGHNGQFQRLLNIFQATYKNDLESCRNNFRRQMLSEEQQGSPQLQSQITRSKQETRDLQGRIFNPFHSDFVRSIYFLGYEGSMTEPPCGQWVSWRLLDTPMTVSYTQLFQAKNILFNHVSPSCERTSVHVGQSVARPIQDTFGRPVWKCTSRDYIADADKN